MQAGKKEEAKRQELLRKLVGFAEYVAERGQEVLEEEAIQGPAASVLDAFISDAKSLLAQARKTGDR